MACSLIPSRGGIKSMRNYSLEYDVDYRVEYHRSVLGLSYRLAVEFYKNATVRNESAPRRRHEFGWRIRASFLERTGIKTFSM